MEKNENNVLEQVSIRLKRENGLYSDNPIKTPVDAIKVIGQELLADLDREALCIVNLKSDGTPINFSVVSIGSINKSMVSTREVMKSAILSNAARAIIIHNHPSGNIKVSRDDIEATKKLLNAFKLMNIDLLDHVIVGAGEPVKYYSMREEDVIDFQHYRIEMDDEITFKNSNKYKGKMQGVTNDPQEENETNFVEEDSGMQEYVVTIREVLERKVKVMAESFWDAENIVQEKYRNEEIVLTADDFVECDLFCREDKSIYFCKNDAKNNELYFGKTAKYIDPKSMKSIGFER